MSNIERDMLAPTIRREVHERLIDQATAIIEARERDMYEAMRERDEARQQLAGAVGLLRESRRYVAGHAFTQPVGDSVAAALLARIDAALGEGQSDESAAQPDRAVREAARRLREE